MHQSSTNLTYSYEIWGQTRLIRPGITCVALMLRAGSRGQQRAKQPEGRNQKSNDEENQASFSKGRTANGEGNGNINEAEQCEEHHVGRAHSSFPSPDFGRLTHHLCNEQHQPIYPDREDRLFSMFVPFLPATMPSISFNAPIAARPPVCSANCIAACTLGPIEPAANVCFLSSSTVT